MGTNKEGTSMHYESPDGSFKIWFSKIEIKKPPYFEFIISISYRVIDINTSLQLSKLDNRPNIPNFYDFVPGQFDYNRDRFKFNISFEFYVPSS